MPNPVDNSDLYDQIVLAGTVSPGIAEVSTASRPYKWDIKEAKGSGGASLAYQGEGLAKGFKVKFKLWKEPGGVDHFAAWDTFKLLLKKSPDPKVPVALDIQHPWLDELDIRSAVVDDIGQMTHAGKGLFEVIVTFNEYQQPRKSGGTPKASKADAKAPQKPVAEDAADAEIAALLERAMKPATGGVFSGLDALFGGGP